MIFSKRRRKTSLTIINGVCREAIRERVVNLASSTSRLAWAKTAAVVLAWLWNRLRPSLNSQQSPNFPQWPRRLVYCLPMRTLVEQTGDNVQVWALRLALTATRDGSPERQRAERALAGAVANIQRAVWLEDDAGTRKWDHAGKLAEHFDVNSREELLWLAEHLPIILMGGEEADRDWDIYPEKPAILIGTQDMLLSRALNRGYGMSRYRRPMHFGLLNNDCLWVMDETQLMGPGLWTSGQLDWMRNHRFGVMKPCATWWMSATNSPVFLDTPDRRKQQLAIPSVVEVGDDQKVLSRLNTIRPLSFWKDAETKPKSKKKGASGTEFSEVVASEVRNEHTPGTLSLVVCNSVRAAQALYRRISALVGSEDVILITSRFRRGDRDAHTKRLLAFEEQRKYAAKDSKDDTVPDSPGLICVSTQVIEAGVDISARRLWMEAAPWSSVLQRLGRLNRDGRADGKAKAFVFVWPEERKKGKVRSDGPYETRDVESSVKLLMKLATIYEDEATLGAWAAMEKLRATAGPEMDAALKPKEEPFPRANDVHGLFSTEPDLFGGFTDVSGWVRGEDKNADVTVFWREFDPKKGPGKSAVLTGPAFDAMEGCAVALHRFREFLGEKGRALVWDERSEEWQSMWPGDICPGMVVMLPRTAGGYSEKLGWTGQASDQVSMAGPPGRFTSTYEDDMDSEHACWVALDSHLSDAKSTAIQILGAASMD